MKKLLLLSTFLFVMAVGAQINCTPNVFYGTGNDLKVHKYTISGNTVIHNGSVTNASEFSALGLAIADLGDGAAFYSAKSSATVLYGADIMKYSAGNWQLIYSDDHIKLQAAGKGNNLYFQNMNIPGTTQYVNRIEKFDMQNLTTVTVWDDNTIATTVGDMAVDEAGNIYFFNGDFDGNTQALKVLTPTGILRTYPVSFQGTGAFGCFISGSTIYVGFAIQSSLYPNKLLPITISGTNAVVGTPLTIPTVTIGTGPNGSINLYLSDLDSCASGNLLALPDAEMANTIDVFASDNHLKVLSRRNGNASIFNALGQKISNLVLTENQELKIDISNYSNGIYFIHFNFDGQNITKKFLKQ